MSKYRPPEATAVRKRIRLFLAAHVAAPVVIYGAAVLAGGGLAATPMPPETPTAAPMAMPSAAASGAGTAASTEDRTVGHDSDSRSAAMNPMRDTAAPALYTRREAPPRWLRDTDRRPAYLSR